jgi:hypothetical protein
VAEKNAERRVAKPSMADLARESEYRALLDEMQRLYAESARKKEEGRRIDAQFFPGRFLPLPYQADVGADLPPVNHPPLFRPPTEVVGGTEFARGVNQYLNEFPDLQGRATKITHGPNAGVIEMLLDSRLSPYDYFDSSLMGTTNRISNAVTLNPSLIPNTGDFDETLGHELGHVAGFHEGRAMEDLEQRARRLGELRPPQRQSLPPKKQKR